MLRHIHKFGGTTTKDKQSIIHICNLLQNEPKPTLITVSASSGITNYLIGLTSRSLSELDVVEAISYLTQHHLKLLEDQREIKDTLREELQKLERLLYGVVYTEELTLRTKDLIISFGERLICQVVAYHLNMSNISTTIISPEDLIVTNGVFERARVELDATTKKTKNYFQLNNLPFDNDVLIVPGYFGASRKQVTTLLGRSGTDYTATSLAYALDAKKVIIWKDVSGFNSADPNLVENTKTISQLSYDEAAELAHFGAKILHPRAILPVKAKKIPIEIREFGNPTIITTIQAQSKKREKDILKSISQMTELSIIRIYMSMGHETSGVLFEISQKLVKIETNPISISTSQTCIAILIRTDQVIKTLQTLETGKGSLIDYVEQEDGIALLCVVGFGLGNTPGIASRVFNATRNANVNVGMISGGGSKAALHFTISQKDLKQALTAVHEEFF